MPKAFVRQIEKVGRPRKVSIARQSKANRKAAAERQVECRVPTFEEVKAKGLALRDGEWDIPF